MKSLGWLNSFLTWKLSGSMAILWLKTASTSTTSESISISLRLSIPDSHLRLLSGPFCSMREIRPMWRRLRISGRLISQPKVSFTWRTSQSLSDAPPSRPLTSVGTLSFSWLKNTSSRKRQRWRKGPLKQTVLSLVNANTLLMNYWVLWRQWRNLHAMMK